VGGGGFGGFVGGYGVGHGFVIMVVAGVGVVWIDVIDVKNSRDE
jgi:hypothetical protein